MDDLNALIDAVEAGVFPADTIAADYGLPTGPNAPTMMEIYSAFSGSLDAALALHKALLPGWKWHIWTDAGATVFPDLGRTFDIGCTVDAYSSTPARAWLLAILRAYRDKPPAKEE